MTEQSKDTSLLFELLWHSDIYSTPILKWGLSSLSYTNTNYASTSTIYKVQMCGPPANTVGWRDYGFIHTALFDFASLRSSHQGKTKIYYVFGDETTSDFSKEHVFHIPPLAGQTKALGQPTTVGKSDLILYYAKYSKFLRINKFLFIALLYINMRYLCYIYLIN